MAPGILYTCAVDNDVKEIIRIPLLDSSDAGLIFGTRDANLKRIEEAFGTVILMRRDEIVVTGSQAARAAGVIEDLLWILESGGGFDEQKLEYVIHLNEGGGSFRTSGANNDVIAFTHRGKPVKSKTLGQTAYIEAIRAHDIVFSIGPAGTGKTYLAVAMAVTAFRAFMKIIAEGSEAENIDPVTQVVHTREMILAFNAKRIATLYSESGRADEAAKAFAEAKAYYEIALQNDKASPETLDYIRNEMAELK